MELNALWRSLSQAARWGLALGALLVVVAVAGGGYLLLRGQDEILFSRLSPQDAAAMTHELEQMKVDYRIADDGTTILVDKSQVHATRLKLMSADLPLHGAVGFELFNNADFGMTEFAQKVNYQRALQGEITRTVLSISEVESARVHLALPDDGLFKKDQQRAKASITVVMKRGGKLRKEQVMGIQRLVAAAVPGIESKDVTIVNDQGVALTSDEGDSVASAPSSGQRMDLKREVEQYLSKKANALLEKTFGEGQAMASVDVVMDMSAVQITKEDVVTPPAAAGEVPSGVVARERETTREGKRASEAEISAEVVSRETDYQLGRKVEKIASAPGAITRVQVIAVVRPSLSASQIDQVKSLLGASVGADAQRGDVVAVQTISTLVSADQTASPSPSAHPAGEDGVKSAREGSVGEFWPVAMVLALLALLVTVLAFAVSRRGGSKVPRPLEPRALSPAQREESLIRVREWLEAPSVGVQP